MQASPAFSLKPTETTVGLVQNQRERRPAARKPVLREPRETRAARPHRSAGRPDDCGVMYTLPALGVPCMGLSVWGGVVFFLKTNSINSLLIIGLYFMKARTSFY